MAKLLLLLTLGVVTVLGQYTASPAGAPPAELAPEVVAALGDDGHKIVAADGGVWAEIWFRNSSVDASESSEVDLAWTTAPHGALIGAIRYPEKAEDRRGQVIRPGVYTLRFSYYPVDGAHQGVEASRDFLVLSPAAIDKDPNTNPAFDELMDMSRKASGTQHPLAIPTWKAEEDWKEGLSRMEKDWVLGVKIGDTPIMVIVKGVNPHG